MGYDRATGLGSVNVANLVNKWATVAGAPAITLNPTSVTFPGTTTVGATDATKETVTVKNTGTALASINSVAISGTNAASFSQTSGCAGSLAAAGSCTVTITFKPQVTGTNTATVTITYNAGTRTQTFTVTGTGASNNVPVITLNPTSLTFPNTIVATASPAQVVTVKNTGTAAASLTSISFTGTNPGSFVKLTNCGSSLAASASCAVFVAFKPASAAALSAVLSVADNAAGSPQKVTLSGAGAVAPPVTVSATSLAFPTTLHGTVSLAKVITVKNTGNAAVHLISIALTGTNPTSFTQINTCTPILAASASCQVYVAFAPTATGALSAKLTITDNGAASPQTVTLTGTGN